jgi:hypothetical protein
MSGREASDRFMDIPLAEPAANRNRMKAPLELLDRSDGDALPPEQRERFEFCRGYERFMPGFFESHTAWERVADFPKHGDSDSVRREIARSLSAEVIPAYTDAVRKVRMSRGGQALIVSLNRRWLPCIVSLRQALALEPVRFEYGPTQHEPLAQGAGSNTFYFDGEKETGAQAVSWQAGAAHDELGQTAIRVDQSVALALGPIVGDRPVSGHYALELIFVNPPSGGESAVEVEAGEGRATLDVTARAGRGEMARLRMAFVVAGNAPEVRIRPVHGAAYLAGALVTPLP